MQCLHLQIYTCKVNYKARIQGQKQEIEAPDWAHNLVEENTELGEQQILLQTDFYVI